MDIAHWYGSDLTAAASGDLAVASGDTETQQRLVRRLMTSPGDYAQHSTYGAGIGRFVGQPTNVGQISGIIKRQMRAERAISQNPPPIVTVTSDDAGVLTANIQYTSALTGDAQVLTLPLGS
jgi:hypothetical protein